MDSEHPLIQVFRTREAIDKCLELLDAGKLAEEVECEKCHGSGEVRMSTEELDRLDLYDDGIPLGGMVTHKDCPTCHGTGTTWRKI